MQRTLFLGNERTLRETCIISVLSVLSSLSTKNLKPKNNTLFRETKKYIYFFLFWLFIFIGTNMPKFWQNSGKLCRKKNIMKKIHFSYFFRTVMYQTLKCMQSYLYEEIIRLYQKPVFWMFFSMLGIKTINNIEVT